MLVILAAEDYAQWPDVVTPDATDLLKAYPADEMKAYQVSTRVNTPNDDAALLERVDPPHPEPRTPLGVDED